MRFSEGLLYACIVASLLSSAATVVALGWMWLRDFKRGSVW